MKRSRRYSAGFTLIELMIVVAIIAVLALLGMVGYGRIIRSSHSAEARHMIGAIKIAHESRRAETGSFAQPKASRRKAISASSESFASSLAAHSCSFC